LGETVRVNQKVVFPLLALLFFCASKKVSAQGTAFFYQGRLNDGGSPATNVYDLRFALYDAATNGNLIAVPQTNFAVAVNSGMFATNVDFGAVFTGTNYWLALGVRTNAGVAPNTNAFTLLWPRQPLLPVPYAIFANSASNLTGTLPAAQLTGTLPSAQVTGNYFGAVNFTNSTNTFLGTFSGNGLNLTNLNGSNIVSGTVADARLSTNVAFLNGTQTFSGANNFTNAYNTFTGNFFGNGLVGWIPIPSNSVQAVRDTGYLLQSSNLTTVTLPTAANLLVGDVIRVSGAGSGGWLIAQNISQSILGNFYSASNTAWIQANTVSGSGAGWQALSSSVDGKNLVASGNNGSAQLYYSQDGGHAWTSATVSLAPVSLASTANGADVIGAINGGGLIISTNYGASWTQISGSSPFNWQAVTLSYNGQKGAAAIKNATSGGIFTNNGYGWGASSAPVLEWTGMASSSDGSKLIAVADSNSSGKVYTSTNSGATWTRQTAAPAKNWNSVASSADGVKLAAVVNGGGIYTSGDSGVTWIQQSNAPSTLWYSISSSASGGELIAVSSTNVYVSANYGATWTPQNIASQNWQASACSGDGSTMVVGGHLVSSSTTGQIYYSQPSLQFTASTTGTNGSLTGPQGSAVELQYIGGNQFMPVGGTGNFWAN
jgi:hypothetical protein